MGQNSFLGVRSQLLLLLTPLTYGCGSEGASPAQGAPELPYQVGATVDGSVDAGELMDAALTPEDAGSSDGSLGAASDGRAAPDAEPLTEDSACAASSLAAEQVLVEVEIEVEVEVQTPAPVALYVMFDRSRSMSDSNLWRPAKEALSDFVHDPASNGMDIAVEYFPSSGGSCNGSGYSTPAVALGRLPEHADAIVSSIDAQSASGIGTPIEGALRGATEYCKAFQASHPEERCVAVLVTDGKPEWDSCEKNHDKLAAIAESAWTQHQVRTFAVGLQGADFELLDELARVGGAEDCDLSSSRFACDVSGGAGLLAAALAQIRDTVTTIEVRTETQTQLQQRPLDCEWRMPQPSGDSRVDKDRVNVTLSGAEAALPLGRVPAAAQCQPDAWHYDSPTSPERIVACPETCESIKSGGYTDVEILLGCQTHIFYQ